MRRRTCRPWWILGVAALLQFHFSPSYAATEPPQPRSVVSLDEGWRFSFGQAPADVTLPEFDDAGWQPVTVPHTWNRLGEVGLERTSLTNSQRGIGWYRLRFTAPSAESAQRSFLQFDAVGTVADVWLNGKKVGSHAGGFSRFRFDVTAALKPGEINLLVVKADNSKPAPGATTQDVIPLEGDFFIHGGLYRDVSLITTSPVHIDLLDHAGPGVYAKTTNIEPGRAEIDVVTRLRNDSTRPRRVNAVIRILDSAGQEVAKTSERIRIPPQSNARTRGELHVLSPRLWQGRADPYLYTVSVEITEGSKTLDAVRQPLGIRSIHVEPDQGLFLNGKHVKLQGVSRHQDRAGKGWALSPAGHEEDMALIAELGANAVRFAHYQHAPEWFELADRYGMLVWAEVPFVNKASLTGEEPTQALAANAQQQLIELIRQNYNHPSVFTWSVGNEVDIGTFLHLRKAGKSLGLLRALHEVAKQEDPSRLTTFADCCEPPPMTIPGREPLAGTTDIIGYNRYFGWYYGKPSDFGATLDLLHQRHPLLPIGVSEYGAGGALSQHTDNPLGGVINMLGRPHPEEIESWYHEQAWPQIAQRAFVWGSFVWNMFDFSSDLRDEGDSVDINNKGLVSHDRKVKKDAFFYYKAQWSAEPVVHIAGSRYVERPYPVVDVRIYSNAPKLRLMLNGSDLGEVDCPQGVCVSPNVALSDGSNEIVASAEFPSGAVTHSVGWRGPDRTKGIAINSGDLVSHRGLDGRLIGSDNFFTGGQARLLNGFSGGGFVATNAKRKSVAGAKDPALYDGYREGTFSYDVPVPNGAWQVTVHSFESVERLIDERTFDVTANDRVVLKAWSPGKAAGGAFKAAAVTFKARVSDGRLRLGFDPVGGTPLVAAITIAPDQFLSVP